MSSLTGDTIGQLFVDKHGTVWRHSMFCEYPTAELERIAVLPPPSSLSGGGLQDSRIKISGAAHARIFTELELRRLVPEPASQSEGV